MKIKKDWYKSKTIISAVVLGLMGILDAVGVKLPYELIYPLVSGFGLFGLREAIGDIK